MQCQMRNVDDSTNWYSNCSHCFKYCLIDARMPSLPKQTLKNGLDQANESIYLYACVDLQQY